jgi:hypothetical protein
MAERRALARAVAGEDAAGALKLRGGESVRVINFSGSGALVECSRRLLPGHRYALQWSNPDGVQALRGEVVRARVLRIQGEAGVAYEVALLFEDPLRLPGAQAERVNSLPVGASSPRR